MSLAWIPAQSNAKETKKSRDQTSGSTKSAKHKQKTLQALRAQRVPVSLGWYRLQRAFPSSIPVFVDGFAVQESKAWRCRFLADCVNALSEGFHIVPPFGLRFEFLHFVCLFWCSHYLLCLSLLPSVFTCGLSVWVCL